MVLTVFYGFRLRLVRRRFARAQQGASGRQSLMRPHQAVHAHRERSPLARQVGLSVAAPWAAPPVSGAACARVFHRRR
jgi:hypothetical protein